MESEDEELKRHREYIDRIDRTIVALLGERMRFGLAAGALKRARAMPLRVEAREQEVLARVREAAAAPLSPESAARIFALVIEETAAAEAREDSVDAC